MLESLVSPRSGHKTDSLDDIHGIILNLDKAKTKSKNIEDSRYQDSDLKSSDVSREIRRGNSSMIHLRIPMDDY